MSTSKIIVGIVLTIFIGMGFFMINKKNNSIVLLKNVEEHYPSTVNLSAKESGILANDKVINNNYQENNLPQDPYQKIDEMIELSQRWLINNIQADGSFVYAYNISGDKSNKNSIARQILTFRVVAKLCQQGDEKFCQMHRKNIDFIFHNGIFKEKILENGQTIAYVQLDDGLTKLGVNALLVRLLLVSPYYDEYTKQVQELISGILYLRHDNGEFYKAFFFDEMDNRAKWLRHYSGESILALLEYYQKTKDDNILQLARTSQDYYYKEYIDNITKNYHPAYVPWQTMALSKMWHETNNPSYIEGIFKLNDKLVKMQDQYNSNKGMFFDEGHLEYGKAHSASDAVYAESLVVAYEIALETGDEVRQQRYMIAIRLVLDYLATLQFCNSNNISYENIPDNMCGGFIANLNANFSRVDSLSHTMDFLDSLKDVLGIYNN